MSSPHISFLLYSNDPEKITNTWKFIDRLPSLTSWELIVGADTKKAYGEPWIHMKHTFSKAPNVSLYITEMPSEKTDGARIQFLATKASGYFLTILNNDYRPTEDLFTVIGQQEKNSVIHVGALSDKDKTVRSNKITCAYDLYKANLFPRGLVIFPRHEINRLGGINVNLRYGHTYDLVNRMYVNGETFQFHDQIFSTTDQPHDYIDREELEELGKVGHAYFYALIKKDAQDIGLGSGDITIHGQTGLDDHVALHWDAEKRELQTEKGFTIRDQELGILRASDILNYISPDDSISFIEECWRVLAPAGWFLTTTPSSSGAGGFADPRNKSFWNTYSFGMFCLESHEPMAKHFNCLFEHVRVWESFPTSKHEEANYSYVNAELRKLELGTSDES